MTVDDPGLVDFPLRSRGALFEDFEVGQVIDHHWGRTLTDGDNTVFSTAMCWWNPMFLNVEYARRQGHPKAEINPMLVLCTVVGLSVEDLSEAGGPFLGIDDCVFERSMYAGDTVMARSVVLERRLSTSRPEAGIVTWRTEGRNQVGDLVVRFVRTNLIARRTQGAPG